MVAALRRATPPQPPEVMDVEVRTQNLIPPDPALVHHFLATCEQLYPNAAGEKLSAPTSLAT